MTATVNPRSLGIETEFIPDTIEELDALRVEIIELGHSHREAGGLAGWLLDKKAGRPDRTSSDTRAQYRKVLAEVAERRRPKPPRRRRAGAQRGGTGRAPIILVPGVPSSRAWARAA